MNSLLVIAQKDLRLLTRDRGAIFWAGAFPILFAVLFGAVVPSARSAHTLAIAVSGADDLAAPLASAGLAVSTTDVADGLARVHRGTAIAALAVSGTDADLVVDPTHPAEAAVIEATVARVLTASSCHSSPAIHRSSVDGGTPPSGFALALPAAVLWGLIGCAGAFATASVAERRAGTHLRLLAAPISHACLMGGKLLACLIGCLVDTVLLLLVARIAFHVRVERFAALPVAIAACAICFAGITVLLGVLGRTEQSVGGSGWATLLLFSMIGGGMVPLSVMPAWLRALSDVSPVKWGIAALEGATLRGLTVRELAPTLGVLVAIGFGCVASAITFAGREPS